MENNLSDSIWARGIVLSIGECMGREYMSRTCTVTIVLLEGNSWKNKINVKQNSEYHYSSGILEEELHS